MGKQWGFYHLRPVSLPAPSSLCVVSTANGLGAVNGSNSVSRGHAPFYGELGVFSGEYRTLNTREVGGAGESHALHHRKAGREG